MLDLDALNKQLAQTVKDAVAEEAHKLRSEADNNELICSALKKPLLVFPDDVSLVLGMGRTTAFGLPKDDASFPARIAVGRRQFVATARFMSWLASKEVGAA